MKLIEAISFYKRNLLSGKELVDAALKALEDGYDSESLRILAGEIEYGLSNIAPLFDKIIKELNISIPEFEDQYYIIAGYFARKIITGELSPYRGAKKIWQSIGREEKTPADIMIFVGAASEIEDLPSRYSERPDFAKKFIAEYEEKIKEQAEKINADYIKLVKKYDKKS